MSRADLPIRSAPPGPRWHRWLLHGAVLLLAIAAVAFVLRERAAGGSSRNAAGDMPPSQIVPPSPVPSPTVTTTPMPSPSPTPTPTLEPTPTTTPEQSPEPTPKPSPSPAPTPEPTPPPPSPTPQPAPAVVRTPAPTPRPAAVVARAIDTASLRTGPSTDAAITGYLPAGSVVTVVGCSGGCSWLLVASASGTAWSARHFWAVTGDLSAVGAR